MYWYCVTIKGTCHYLVLHGSKIAKLNESVYMKIGINRHRQKIIFLSPNDNEEPRFNVPIRNAIFNEKRSGCYFAYVQ